MGTPITSVGNSRVDVYGGGSAFGLKSGGGWAEAFAKARATNDRVAQQCGMTLDQQNAETEQQLDRMGLITKAKAQLVKLLGRIPVPKESDDDKDLPLSRGGVTQDDLKTVNYWLDKLGYEQLTPAATKSGLDSLQTSLTGDQEQASGRQGMLSSKISFYINKIQTTQTIDQGLIKGHATVEQGYARGVAPV